MMGYFFIVSHDRIRFCRSFLQMEIVLQLYSPKNGLVKTGFLSRSTDCRSSDCHSEIQKVPLDSFYGIALSRFTSARYHPLAKTGKDNGKNRYAVCEMLPGRS